MEVIRKRRKQNHLSQRKNRHQNKKRRKRYETKGFFSILGTIQGHGNTMPDLFDMIPFHSGQVKNFYLLVLGQVLNKFYAILYFHFLLIVMNSQCHVVWKTVWILISWLMIWIYTVFNLIYIWFHTVFKKFIHDINQVRAKLSSLCIICSLRQIEYSLNKYIMVIYLFLGNYLFFTISTPQGTWLDPQNWDFFASTVSQPKRTEQGRL